MMNLGHKRSEYQSVIEQVDAQVLTAAQLTLFTIAEKLGEPADEVTKC